MLTQTLLGGLAFYENSQTFQSLQESFPTDLEDSLCDELLQFSGFLNTEFARNALDATTPSASDSLTPGISSDQSIEDDDIDVTEDDNLIGLNVELLELRMYKLLVTNNLETVFPNTVIASRIYLSMIISNCSGERSFSKLKLKCT